MSIDQCWADIDPCVPFHSVIPASYLFPSKTILFGSKEEGMLFNPILLMLRASSFMYWLSVYRGGARIDADWWPSRRGHQWSFIAASSMRAYMPNEASFNLTLADFILRPSPLTVRGGLDWIIHSQSYQKMNTGIDASLLFSDVSHCAAQCFEKRGMMEIQGLADQKRIVIHSISFER